MEPVPFRTSKPPSPDIFLPRSRRTRRARAKLSFWASLDVELPALDGRPGGGAMSLQSRKIVEPDEVPGSRPSGPLTATCLEAMTPAADDSPARLSGVSLICSPAATLGRKAQRRRFARIRQFGSELGQDGVWNMLLELVVARLEQKMISTKCLWLASGAPQSSALRWVNHLVADGHLARSLDPADARRHFLRIDDELFDRVVAFLVATEADG